MSTMERPKPRLATSREPDDNPAAATTNPPTTRVEQIRYAILCARTSRDWLKQADAGNAARYMSRAIKSLEGAERHALRLERQLSDANARMIDAIEQEFAK